MVAYFEKARLLLGLAFRPIAVVLLLAGGTPAISKPAKAGLCFSQSASPHRMIADCTRLLLTGSIDANEKARILLSRAGALGRKGDYHGTIEDSSAVIRQAPSAAAYYTRALAYHNLGNETAALEDCNAALILEPDNANAFFVRGTAYQAMDDFSSAIRDYSEALRRQPTRREAYVARGTAYYAARDFERAVNDFSEAVDLGAADAGVFYLRGLAYRELGRTAESEADMNSALRLRR